VAAAAAFVGLNYAAQTDFAATAASTRTISYLRLDPDYTYTLVSGGMAWEAHANAKKPGLLGFCFMARSVGTTVTTYSKTGKAGWVATEIMRRGIDGDSFETQ
jgi:hypothetical protein